MLSLAIDVHASGKQLVLIIVMTFRKVKSFGGNSQESMRATNNSNCRLSFLPQKRRMIRFMLILQTRLRERRSRMLGWHNLA